jgi:hypothetical protein
MTTPTPESSSWFPKISGIFSDSQASIDEDYKKCSDKCTDNKSSRQTKLSSASTTTDPNAKPFYQFWGGKRRRTKRSQKGGKYSPLQPADYNAVGGKRRKSTKKTKRRQRGGNADAKPTPQPQVSAYSSPYTSTAGEYKAVGGKRRKSTKRR